MRASYKQSGFSLVELLVAMVVGLIIVTGAFSLHSTSRTTQKVSEAQMDMVADARFAIETLSHDLRHAGMWGETNADGLIACKSTDAACVSTSNGDTPPTTAIGDCAAGWFRDLQRSVFATDDTVGNPYSGTCIKGSEGYKVGTDIIDIRYADSNLPVPPLDANTVHVRSNFLNGRIFVGATPPLLPRKDSAAFTTNHVLHAYSYFISDHTDDPSDGIPSLRRISLVSGPEMKSETLISGVVDMQIQFGEDLTGNNQIVNSYVDPQNVTNWDNVYAAKIWLVMRSDEPQDGVDTKKTFDIAGQSRVFGGPNGYRHFMVSSVVNLRNLKQ